MSNRKIARKGWKSLSTLVREKPYMGTGRKHGVVCVAGEGKSEQMPPVGGIRSSIRAGKNLQKIPQREGEKQQVWTAKCDRQVPNSLSD